MLQALINFLLNRKGHPVQHDTPTMEAAPVAPYKLEPPEPVTQAKTSKPAEKPAKDSKPRNPRAKKAPAAKSPAAITAAKKSRAKKAPAAK